MIYNDDFEKNENFQLSYVDMSVIYLVELLMV